MDVMDYYKSKKSGGAKPVTVLVRVAGRKFEGAIEIEPVQMPGKFRVNGDQFLLDVSNLEDYTVINNTLVYVGRN